MLRDQVASGSSHLYVGEFEKRKINDSGQRLAAAYASGIGWGVSVTAALTLRGSLAHLLRWLASCFVPTGWG